MATLTLESLGLTREEILDRVASQLCERLMSREDGSGDAEATSFARRVEKKTLACIDAAVAALAAQHVLPNVSAYVEALTLQETNRWGEKKGAPVTFIEYLVQRAEAFLREEVDFSGKARGEDTYHSGWKSAGTRIAWMVHQHLQYSIQTAMEQALKSANAAIVGGIESAVKIKLAEVAASLKVTAKIGG